MIVQETILVVDDSAANVQLLHSALSGYRVVFALNGEDALRIARQSKPDLALIDVLMPGMDGYELCRRLKLDEALREVPVIFITSLARSADEERGLALGAVDYITKPVVPALLRLRVHNQLELKRQRDLLERRTAELEEAVSRVRQLEGIIPICMYCKKIKNDEDYWQQVESYLAQHSAALFSHGVCPDCFQKQMREIDERD